MTKMELRELAEKRVEDRILDLLIPKPPSLKTGGDYLSPVIEKFRVRLRDGVLDKRKIEIYEESPEDTARAKDLSVFLVYLLNQSLMTIAARNPKTEVSTISLQDVLDEAQVDLAALVGRPRRKLITVSAARDIFLNQELAKLSLSHTEKDYESSLLVPSSEIVLVEDSLLALTRERPSLLDEISHRQFEELLREILVDRGFQVELTATTRDGGCDLIAISQDQLGINTKYIVEAKHYRRSNKVGVGAVRQLSAVRQKLAAHHGLLVTTSYFSPDAIRENNAFYGLHLHDYDKLLDWLKA